MSLNKKSFTNSHYYGGCWILQIAQYAVGIISKVSEIYGTVNDSPAKLRDGIEQLNRLVVTAKMVAALESLQSEDINDHVMAILARVRKLHSAVNKLASEPPKSLKRYWKVAIGNTTEKHVFDSFVQLEKDKSSLILGLAVNQVRLTGSVQRDVQAMHHHLERALDLKDLSRLGFEDSLPSPDLRRTMHRTETFSTLVGSESQDAFSVQEDGGKNSFRKRIYELEMSNSQLFNDILPAHPKASARSELRYDEPRQQKRQQSSRELGRVDVKNEPAPFGTKSSTWDESKARSTARKTSMQSLQQTRDVYRNMSTTDNARQVNGNLGDRGRKIERPRHYEWL